MIVIQKINRVTYAVKKRVYRSEDTTADFTARITYFRKTGLSNPELDHLLVLLLQLRILDVKIPFACGKSITKTLSNVGRVKNLFVNIAGKVIAGAMGKPPLSE